MSFKKYLKRGQATLEYLILFGIIAAMSILSLNYSFLSKVQDSMQGPGGFFEMAATRIIRPDDYAPLTGGGNPPPDDTGGQVSGNSHTDLNNPNLSNPPGNIVRPINTPATTSSATPKNVSGRQPSAGVSIDELIKALGDKDPNVRRAAIDALVKLGSSAVEALIKALGDSNSLISQGAAEALGRIGDSRAVVPLLKAAFSNDGLMVQAPIDALLKMGSVAVDKLIEVLANEKEVYLRQAAIWMLELIGDPRAIDAYIQALNNDESWDVRHAAVHALAAYALKDIGGSLDALIQALNKDRDWRVSSYAAWILGQIGGTRALDALIKVVVSNDIHPNVRRAAVQALADIGGTRAVEALIKALGDEDWQVREAAAQGLGRIGDARAVEALIELLKKDSMPLVVGAAAEALAKIGGIQAIDALIEFMNTYFLKNGVSGGDLLVRQALAKALSDISLEPLIIKALSDENSYVRRFAVQKLGNILYYTGDARAEEALIRALSDNDSKVRREAAAGLGKKGNTQALEPLIIKALSDEDIYVREAAALALGQIGDPRALDALIKVVSSDKDSRVRVAAVQALMAIGDARAVEAFIKALSDEDTVVRQTAIAGLGMMGDKSAVEPLIKALSDNDSSVRQAAAFALGRIGDARAVTALIKLLDDNDSSVRQAAAYALGAIGDARAAESLVKCLASATDWQTRMETESALIKIMGELSVESVGRVMGKADPALINYMLTLIAEKQRIRDDIAQKFQVTIPKDTREIYFTSAELKTLQLILGGFNPELIKGLTIAKAMADLFTGARYDGDNTITLSTGINNPSDFIGRLSHEIGHVIDAKYFNFMAFEELHNKSKFSEDFAWTYGRENRGEDFATTVKEYLMNSQEEFKRGIGQAQQGRPVYLEKLIFVLDVFTQGHPDYATVQKVEGDSISQRRIGVARDGNGKITAIGGVPISDLEGLKNLFNGLTFNL